MAAPLEIVGVKSHEENDQLVIDVTVLNSTDRTLHAYSVVRKIFYDADSKLLRLMLGEQPANTSQTISTFVLPTMVGVDAKGQSDIRVTFPRVLTRLATGQQPQLQPKFESMAIHEFTAIELEVAWSDTPFYADPRSRDHVSHQLASWPKGAARARFTRERGQTTLTRAQTSQVESSDPPNQGERPRRRNSGPR